MQKVSAFIGAALVILTASSAASPGSGPDQAVRDFQSRQGGELRIQWDFDSGYPVHIHGKAMDVGTQSLTDAGFVQAARDLFDDNPELMGFDSSVLQLRHVRRLPLSQVGSVDKVSVVFDQVVDGIPTEFGSASVLFLEDGRAVSIQSNAIPQVAKLDTFPRLTQEAGIERAQNLFGHTVQDVISSELVVVRSSDSSSSQLAWNVGLLAEERNRDLPIQEMLSIDAHTGELIRRTNQIHTFTDLIGWTRQWATPGDKPDTPANPEQLFNSHFVHHESAVGDADSDINGNWTVPYGGNTVQAVTARFGSNSKYAYVDNRRGNGKDQSKTKNATPGVLRKFRFNRAKIEKWAAGTNAQRNVVIFREWIRSIDPGDNTMEFRVRANTNLNSTCNAFYNGGSINFYWRGGGCPNTCYTTVVAHEEGHWANDKYGSGNGPDGFGEGNADIFAMYIYDTNIVGRDFCGTGCHVRDGENTRQYCGSCGAGCYGGVHANGMVLMGAAWKVRKRLNNALGDAGGDLVADTLMLGWMNAYNDNQICTSIRDHWLILDDDDGDLTNGSPNYAHIDGGFVDQGFPPY